MSNYEILIPDPRRGPHRSVEELLEDYITLLNPIVMRIGQGRDGLPLDTVVFLDKSARPLAWMLRQLWPHIASQHRNKESGDLVIAAMPAMKFVRIDRLDWRLDPRLSFREGGMRSITQSDVDGLRAIFRIGRDNILERARMLIVDEQSETGDTLRIAELLFSTAFPEAHVEAVTWIASRIDPATGFPRVEKIPAWYPLERNWSPSEDQTGRGVFDPVPYNDAWPAHGPRFPPESYQYLAVPAVGGADSGHGRERDAKSVQLRREVDLLVHDFLAGRLHPLITAERVEIRGVPADDYGRAARQVRARRA